MGHILGPFFKGAPTGFADRLNVGCGRRCQKQFYSKCGGGRNQDGRVATSKTRRLGGAGQGRW